MCQIDLEVAGHQQDELVDAMLAAVFVLSLLPAPLHRTGGVAVLRAARTPRAASNVVMLEPVERGETGYKRYVVKQLFRKAFTPKKVAAEEQARREEAERIKAEERRAVAMKAFEEEQAREKEAAEKAAAEQAIRDAEEAEAERIRNQERIARQVAEKEAREQKKADEEAAEAAKREAAQAKLEKLKEIANKAAEEEQRIAAEKKAAEDKAAAEKKAAEDKAAAEAAAAEEARLAAIEAAKTPEQREAEAEAKRAEEEAAAEAAAAAAAPAAVLSVEERVAEASRLEAEALAALDLTLAAQHRETREAAERELAGASAAPAAAHVAASAGAAAPDEDYVRPEGPATAAAVRALLDGAMSPSSPRVLTFGDMGDARGEALRAMLSEIEAAQPTDLTADAVRAELLGFWRLLCTSSADKARLGSTGCSKAAHRTLLAQFQCFSPEPPDGSDPDFATPLMQTVEVVSDARLGASAVAANKGDFHLGKLSSTGTLGVVEDYHRLEIDGESQSGASLPAPLRWGIASLSPELRVTREEDGSLCVFERLSPADAQAEIARLMALPVQAAVKLDGFGAADPDDDRPLWQRRLDAERQEEAMSSIP